MIRARSAESTAGSVSLASAPRSAEVTLGSSRERMPASVAPTVWKKRSGSVMR